MPTDRADLAHLMHQKHTGNLGKTDLPSICFLRLGRDEPETVSENIDAASTYRLVKEKRAMLG